MNKSMLHCMSAHWYCNIFAFSTIFVHAMIAKAGQLLTFDEKFGPSRSDTKLITSLTHILSFILQSDFVNEQSTKTFIIGNLCVVCVSELLAILKRKEKQQYIILAINAWTLWHSSLPNLRLLIQFKDSVNKFHYYKCITCSQVISGSGKPTTSQTSLTGIDSNISLCSSWVTNLGASGPAGTYSEM